jgi:hypothetical protein
MGIKLTVIGPVRMFSQLTACEGWEGGRRPGGVTLPCRARTRVAEGIAFGYPVRFPIARPLN